MPVFATVSAFAMLSSAGLPLLNGFIGEFTILQGAFEANRAWLPARSQASSWARPTYCGCTSAPCSDR